MILDDLLSKFDCIEEFPVPEEMLGAYMEGKLDSFECRDIERIISRNELLLDFVDECASSHVEDDHFLHTMEPAYCYPYVASGAFQIQGRPEWDIAPVEEVDYFHPDSDVHSGFFENPSEGDRLDEIHPSLEVYCDEDFHHDDDFDDNLMES